MTSHEPSHRWLCPLLFAFALGCGDDEASAVAESCGAACTEVVSGCAIPNPNPQTCRSACELAGSLALECADEYASVIDCATANPLLACRDNAVSITLTGDCLAPLSNYLVCAATSILPACVDLPLQNPTCAAQGLPRAAACVGEVSGCVLQAGAVVDAQGVGLFCCQ